MALSGNDGSSLALDNFQLFTTCNDDDVNDVLEIPGKISSTTSHVKHETSSFTCLFCNTQQKKFHCRECVRGGRITSAHQPLGESLTEKQQKYLNIHAGLQVYNQRYECLIKSKRAKENMRFEIKCYQKQVALIQQVVLNKQEFIKKLRELHNELLNFNHEKRNILPKYPLKVKELENFSLDRSEKIGKLKERRQLLLNRLKDVTCRNIRQLVQYVFPISEVILDNEERCTTVTGNYVYCNKKRLEVSTVESETVAALADAQNTSYIRGKWVFHGSGISEMQYRIVAPSLPANGDYSAYLDWLKDNKDDMPKCTTNEIMPSFVNAFRIIGALTYTTQLTQLISYYLNIRLPYKLTYGEFCKKLKEEQFLRKVSRLNSNIMYLAYTQKAKLRSLNENHTLENILILLDIERCHLGCYGYQDVSNAPLNKSLDSLLTGIETGTESESEDENSLRLDWEAVPNLSTQNETMQSALMSNQHQQQFNVTEGLITSAANRINSIWRWIK